MLILYISQLTVQIFKAAQVVSYTALKFGVRRIRAI